MGSNWALTAAHCLYSRETGEVRAAASLQVLPGLHQRSRPGLALRWVVARGRDLEVTVSPNTCKASNKWRLSVFQ